MDDLFFVRNSCLLLFCLNTSKVFLFLFFSKIFHIPYLKVSLLISFEGSKLGYDISLFSSWEKVLYSCMNPRCQLSFFCVLFSQASFSISFPYRNTWRFSFYRMGSDCLQTKSKFSLTLLTFFCRIFKTYNIVFSKYIYY